MGTIIYKYGPLTEVAYFEVITFNRSQKLFFN